jgi:hypothetical protein
MGGNLVGSLLLTGVPRLTLMRRWQGLWTGVVYHSSDGTFLGASATVYDGISHPGILEALTCREALDAAANLLLGLILVASDCLEVVKGLHEENSGVLGIILREIKDRPKISGDTTFSHERREANVEAHRLARFASSLPVGRHVWFTVGLKLLTFLNKKHMCSQKNSALWCSFAKSPLIY